VIVTPQYPVLKMIMSGVPLGSRLFAVRELKQLGVGVWMSAHRVNFLIVRPGGRRAPGVYALDVSPIVEAAAFKAAEGAPAAAAVAAADSGDATPANTPAAPAAAVAARVRLLDLAAVEAAGSGAPGAGPAETVEEVAADADGTIRVEVPPGHLAVVEVSSA
jgi:hypothetical protein